MQISLSAGAEVDIASGRELSDGFDDLKDFMGKRQDALPHYFVQSGQASSLTGPVNTIVQVGSPPVGSAWNVLGFSICGEDDNVASTAGTVSLYIGGVPASGNPSLAQLRRPALTIPSAQDLNGKTYWCASGQYVFFKLTAIAGITAFVGNVFIAEYRLNEVVSRVGR